MRLSELDVSNLLKGLYECTDTPKTFRLFLFGSRTDPKKKGGDIDLLLIVDDTDFTKIISRKHYLLTALKKYLDDQKVDLTVFARKDLLTDPFYQTIKSEIILLAERLPILK